LEILPSSWEIPEELEATLMDLIEPSEILEESWGFLGIPGYS